LVVLIKIIKKLTNPSGGVDAVLEAVSVFESADQGISLVRNNKMFTFIGYIKKYVQFKLQEFVI